MSIKKTFFKSSEEPLKLEVKVHTPQVATYTLWLWEKKTNAIVMKKRGNNQNTEDDIYALPTPCRVNDGRFVECAVVLIDPEGKGKYEVELAITQGGNTLNTFLAQGDVVPESVTATFMTKLILKK